MKAQRTGTCQTSAGQAASNRTPQTDENENARTTGTGEGLRRARDKGTSESPRAGRTRHVQQEHAASEATGQQTKSQKGTDGPLRQKTMPRQKRNHESVKKRLARKNGTNTRQTKRAAKATDANRPISPQNRAPPKTGNPRRQRKKNVTHSDAENTKKNGAAPCKGNRKSKMHGRNPQKRQSKNKPPGNGQHRNKRGKKNRKRRNTKSRKKNQHKTKKTQETEKRKNPKTNKKQRKPQNPSKTIQEQEHQQKNPQAGTH